LDEQTLEEKAQALDNMWFVKHKTYLDQLKLPVECLTWKALLQKTDPHFPDFTTFQLQLNQHYQENKEFRNLVMKHARQYVGRKITQHLQDSGRSVEFDDFLSVAIDYILEELAAFVQLMKCGADFLTYPGGINPPARHVLKHFFKEAALKYAPYAVEEPQVKNTSFFQSTPCNNMTLHYTQWSLRQVKWCPIQEFQFIQRFNQLVDEITQSQPEPPSEIIKTTHRRSL
jgi:hypothetical protein